MPHPRDNKSDNAPVQCGACGSGIAFEPGQLVGDPAAIEWVKQLDADLKALAYAIFRSNAGWSERPTAGFFRRHATSGTANA